MRKINRLLKHEDFQRVLNQGVKYRDDCFLMAATLNKEGHLRAGISVSRKVGDAVCRVRVRRQVRAIIGGLNILSCPIDLVIIPKHAFMDERFAELAGRTGESNGRIFDFKQNR